MQKYFSCNSLEIAEQLKMVKVYTSVVIAYTTLTLIMNLMVR